MIYSELIRGLLPEIILVLGALSCLSVDLFFLRDRSLGRRWRISSRIALATLLIGAGGAHLFLPNLSLAEEMLVIDPLVQWIKVVLLLLGAMVALLSGGARFSDHPAEYHAILLLAISGMTLMVSTENLIMIFVAVELTSLSLYALVGFDKRSAVGAEAALKYFLYGGASAAMILFGFGYLYGVTGVTDFGGMSAVITGQGWTSFLAIGVVLSLLGFAFKIAAAPFHMWAPDVYQGAPTAVAALVASGSKVATFFVLVKFLVVAMGAVDGRASWGEVYAGWAVILAFLIVVSVLIGNLMALVQTCVKRLIAYSAVAHAGYALLGILSNNMNGLVAVIYYSVTYAVTIIGVFAIVGLLENDHPEQKGEMGFSRFSGLSRRSPLASVGLLIFFLSLAGIPPLAGFFGKYFLFVEALRGETGNGLIGLIVVTVGASAVSLYYYLQVLKYVFVEDADKALPQLAVPDYARIVILVAAALTVILGCAPSLMLEPLTEAISMLPK